MSNRSIVFDYRVLRLLVGIIALALPILVNLISSTTLESISASYFTEARNAFVGLLFVVGAFFLAYNGHTTRQAWASRVAAICAIVVALCPTSCPGCEPDLGSWIHYVAAGVLFSILAYFCLGPFQERTKGRGGKAGRRSRIYAFCGWLMVVCMIVLVAATLVLPEDTVKGYRIVYYSEAVALLAFGVAWIVAGKVIPAFVDREDALPLFGMRQAAP